MANRDHLIFETVVKRNCTYAACLNSSVSLHCWFDPAKTCPEPGSFVDRQVRVILDF